MGDGALPMNLVLLMSVVVVVFSMHGNVNAMSTIKAMSKDQIACSMCYSCENPCQPILSPPLPPPPPPSPPPPPPSTPPTYYCPPPPPDTGNYYPPPAPGTGSYFQPPPPSFLPFPTSPPNPLAPSFPVYSYSPPQDSFQNNSIRFGKPTSRVLFLLILFSIFFIFRI